MQFRKSVRSAVGLQQDVEPDEVEKGVMITRI